MPFLKAAVRDKIQGHGGEVLQHGHVPLWVGASRCSSSVLISAVGPLGPGTHAISHRVWTSATALGQVKVGPSGATEMEAVWRPQECFPTVTVKVTLSIGQGRNPRRRVQGNRPRAGGCLEP